MTETRTLVAGTRIGCGSFTSIIRIRHRRRGGRRQKNFACARSAVSGRRSVPCPVKRIIARCALTARVALDRPAPGRGSCGPVSSRTIAVLLLSVSLIGVPSFLRHRMRFPPARAAAHAGLLWIVLAASRRLAQTNGDKAVTWVSGRNRPILAVDPTILCCPSRPRIRSTYQSTESDVYPRVPAVPPIGRLAERLSSIDSQSAFSGRARLSHGPGGDAVAVQSSGRRASGYPVGVGARRLSDTAANDRSVAIDIGRTVVSRPAPMVWTDVLLTSRVAVACSADQGREFTLRILSTRRRRFSWPHTTAQR
jgi:hypothetical protein